MPRVLLRAGRDPLVPMSEEASLASNGWGIFGANAGNLLFSSSVHRAISARGVEVVPDSYLTELHANSDDIARINAEFDAFVVPLANAFRVRFIDSLSRLTRAIEQLTVPVTVIGVGLQLSKQSSLSDVPPELREATRKFVTAVLARSSSIGVRGETTRTYLRGLGFPDSSIDVIGCPSLFYRGADLQVVKRAAKLDSASPIAINITPSVTSLAALIERHVHSYPNMTYIAQEHYELATLMWGSSARPLDRRIPTYSDHPLYRQDRVRFFLDASTWLAFMSTVEFAFGTRIHGNIAAVMAGTPALVLTHDSRTLELAEYHELPHRPAAHLDSSADAARLYEMADFTRFNAGHPARFEVYRKFLERNGVQHIFTPGNENPEYDRKLASTAFPPPVGNILTAEGLVDPRAVVHRLRWLRQGPDVDKGRAAAFYSPPFGTPARGATDDRLRLEVRRLTAQVETFRTRLESCEDALNTLSERQPMRKRIRAKLRKLTKHLR